MHPVLFYSLSGIGYYVLYAQPSSNTVLYLPLNWKKNKHFFSRKKNKIKEFRNTYVSNTLYSGCEWKITLVFILAHRTRKNTHGTACYIAKYSDNIFNDFMECTRSTKKFILFLFLLFIKVVKANGVYKFKHRLMSITINSLKVMSSFWISHNISSLCWWWWWRWCNPQRWGVVLFSYIKYRREKKHLWLPNG